MKTDIDRAMECGMVVKGDPLIAVGSGDQLAAFAAAIRAEEREKCAVIADKHSGPSTMASENSDMYAIQNRWAKVISAAIRSIGAK